MAALPQGERGRAESAAQAAQAKQRELVLLLAEASAGGIGRTAEQLAGEGGLHRSARVWELLNDLFQPAVRMRRIGQESAIK